MLELHFIKRLNILLLLAFVPALTFAQKPHKAKKAQTHIAMGPVLPFYRVNPKHTASSKSGAAFTIYAREYFRINKSASVGIGLQYLIHSNRFKSYYFKDTLKLYDSTYNYDYVCKFQDIGIPVSFKLKLTDNKQRGNSLYTELTWIVKRRIASSMQVNSSKYGYSEYDDIAGDTFKTRYLPKWTGTTLGLSLGYDKNFRDKESGYFVCFTYSYGLNTFYYRRSNELPHDIWQIESFAAIKAGLRF